MAPYEQLASETSNNIKVMQAYVDGHAIQYQDCDGVWCDTDFPVWNFASTSYRVKPANIVRYLNIYRYPWNNGSESAGNIEYKTREEADDNTNEFRIACIRIDYDEGKFDA